MKLAMLISALLIVACTSSTGPEQWPTGSLVKTNKDGGPELGGGYDGLLPFWYQPEFHLPLDRGGGGGRGSGIINPFYKWEQFEINGDIWRKYYYDLPNGERVYVKCLVNGIVQDSCEG